jgi:RNA polymerase sigma factor (sigma-70 family)
MPVEQRWPGPDEKLIVKEMLRDPQSEHWTKCREFIKMLIEPRCRDLPSQLYEDAIQETMASIYNGLPGFRHNSKFTTWLTAIAQNRITDIRRKYAPIILQEVTADETAEEKEETPGTFRISSSRTPEADFLTQETLKETIAKIEEFIKRHSKTERNRQILQMVMFEGYSCEETARVLGISAPVVSYVVRSARGYIR